MKKLLKSLVATTALLVVTVPTSVFAAMPDNSKTASIKASVKEEISLTLSNNLIEFHLEDANLNTDTITVTGSSNTANGYVISFNASTAYDWLKHTSRTANIIIPTLTEDVTESNFPETAWGYTTDTLDQTFKGVSLLPQNIFSTSAPGSNSHDFTIAVKARDDIPAGSYENTLLFTIVGSPNTYEGTLSDIETMQQMNPAVCANSEYEESNQLKDTRDGKYYWVTKLADGNCWMTQNLDYDLSVQANQTLTPATSNVKETRTLGLDEWEAFDLGSAESFVGLDNDRITYLDGGDYYYEDGVTKTAGYSSLPADDENRHYHVGDYYSWRAATAGEGTTEYKDEEVVNESICPAGWRLPAEYNEKVAEYGFDDLDWYYDWELYDGIRNFMDAPFYGTMSGTVFGGSLQDYGMGFYWAANSVYKEGEDDYYYSNYYSYTVGFYQEYFSTYYWLPRMAGANVRCVAQKASHIIMLKEKDGKSLGNEIYDGTYTLPAKPDRDNYLFLGWSEDPDATEPTYLAGDVIEDENKTLYAIYKSKTMQDISTMQEMTSAICAASAIEETKVLKDTRDNTNYTIVKLADGSCWMTSNLSFRTSRNDNTLTIYDSDVTDISTTSYTITSARDWTGWHADTPESYYGYSSAGVYYNYGAAIGRSNDVWAVYPNEDADESICPRGWRLPRSEYSVSGNGDFESVKDAYGVESLYDTPLRLDKNGGHVYHDNAPSYGSTDAAYYITSTKATNIKEHTTAGESDPLRSYIFVNSATGTNEAEWLMLYGFSVRCLAK